MSEESKMEESERALIKMLREEAYSVKDCFTRYSVQGLAIAAGILTFVARYQVEHAEVAYASIAAMLLLMGLGRMGTHKYAAASRLNGYELHLHRTRALAIPSGYEWHDSMRRIGWEEAMRAWRIVSATVFDHLYITRPTKRRHSTVARSNVSEGGSPSHDTDGVERQGISRLKRILRAASGWIKRATYALVWRLHADAIRSGIDHSQPRWFEPSHLMKPGASYYAGGYLGTMLNTLHACTAVFLVPLFVAVYQQWKANDLLQFYFAIWAAAASLVVFLVNLNQVNARKRVIEEGLLSIHSSAILWQATVIAHFRALERLGNEKDGRLIDYDGYTRCLSHEAVDLASDVLNIHRWMRRRPKPRSSQSSPLR